jgi:hypothetical protein
MDWLQRKGIPTKASNDVVLLLLSRLGPAEAGERRVEENIVALTKCGADNLSHLSHADQATT